MLGEVIRPVGEFMEGLPTCAVGVLQSQVPPSCMTSNEACRQVVVEGARDTGKVDAFEVPDHAGAGVPEALLPDFFVWQRGIRRGTTPSQNLDQGLALVVEVVLVELLVERDNAINPSVPCICAVGHESERQGEGDNESLDRCSHRGIGIRAEPSGAHDEDKHDEHAKTECCNPPVSTDSECLHAVKCKGWRRLSSSRVGLWRGRSGSFRSRASRSRRSLASWVCMKAPWATG